MSIQKYWLDIRDDLDDIYPTSSSFVKIIPPQNKYYLELHVNINFPSGREVYMFFCYFYEVSAYLGKVPLIFVLAKTQEAQLLFKYNETVISKDVIDKSFSEYNLNAAYAILSLLKLNPYKSD